MEVTLYTRPQCEWCKKIRTWLRRRRIQFTEHDLYETQNGKYRDELLEKTSQLKVPVTDINGEIVIGFDEVRLEELLKKAKAEDAKSDAKEEEEN